ncbi:Ger(x)C family spore germination protein [Salinithrix halophila]|uniref:Ger(X)C family spore germination protein n=1 Tax=Salinithrix halophila TaxID=1485204 RepID=A0ABV8JCF1_9BACL
MRRYRKLMVLFLCLFLLNGCWDAREIEQRTSVIALAVDKHPKGFEVSVQVPIPTKVVGSGGEGGGGGPEAVQVFTATGKTLTDALDSIQYETNQRVFLGNSRLLLIGEDQARSGVGEMLDAFRRNPQVRRRQWPVVVKGKAKEALYADLKLEQIPVDYIVSMLENGMREGRFPRKGMNDFYVDLANPGKQPVLNYMEVKGKEVRWLGTALFRKDQMVGILDRRETRPLLQIGMREEGETLDVPCVEKPGYVVFTPKGIKRSVRIKNRNGKPEIDVYITVRGEVIEKTCGFDLSKEQSLRRMTTQIRRTSEKRARFVMKKVQKDIKTDAFQLGNIVRAYRPKLWRTAEWDRTFPDIPIRVSYKIKILRTGVEYD